MAVDLSRATIGFFSKFEEGVGRTGYRVSALVRGVEYTWDAVKEVYDLQFTKEYFPYPCIGEILFLFNFDEDGIVVSVQDVNDCDDPKNPVQTSLSMGTMRMFAKKLTPETPTFGELLHFEGNKVIFDRYDEYNQSGKTTSGENMDDTICALYVGGNIPELHNGTVLNLAPDTVIYCWDWGTATHPFCICDREQAKAWNFVEHFSLGTIEDVKRAYWVGFFSTRGDENVIDLIKCFPNKAPGWMSDEEVAAENL